MRGIALHLGRHSAHYHQRPLRFFQAFLHDEGAAIWAGPVGLVIFTR